MADLLKRGMDWLNGRRTENASRAVVYSHGGLSVTLPATAGRTLLRLDDGLGGSRVEWTDRDFVVTAADLVLAGVTVLPQRGATIVETEDDGTVYTFEVNAYGGTEPCWRWVDAYRRQIRIHCKQIGRA